jgi:hypothetical protein
LAPVRAARRNAPAAAKDAPFGPNAMKSLPAPSSRVASPDDEVEDGRSSPGRSVSTCAFAASPVWIVELVGRRHHHDAPAFDVHPDEGATPTHDHGDHHRLRTETAKPILASIVDLGGRDGGRVLPSLCSLGYDAGADDGIAELIEDTARDRGAARQSDLDRFVLQRGGHLTAAVT